MKITFDWLKDHLKTSFKEENLLEQLTNIGLEVESVENLSAGNELFKVAKIIKTELNSMSNQQVQEMLEDYFKKDNTMPGQSRGDQTAMS